MPSLASATSGSLSQALSIRFSPVHDDYSRWFVCRDGTRTMSRYAALGCSRSQSKPTMLRSALLNSTPIK